MTFEPVVSEIFPVKAGAITDDIMPKKVKHAQSSANSILVHFHLAKK